MTDDLLSSISRAVFRWPFVFFSSGHCAAAHRRIWQLSLCHSNLTRSVSCVAVVLHISTQEGNFEALVSRLAFEIAFMAYASIVSYDHALVLVFRCP